MANTKKKTDPIYTYTISHCNVTNTNAPANEHTRDAVVALAKAAEANANAIEGIARALRGGDATMGNAFKIGRD